MEPLSIEMSAVVRHALEIDSSAQLLGEHVPDATVGKAAALEDRDAGSLCWISERRLKNADGLLHGRRAGLVVGPRSLAGSEWAPFAHHALICDQPRLLFSMLVTHFMKPHYEIVWRLPRPDEIPSSTSIAPGVVFGGAVTLGERVTIGPNTVLANCSVGTGCRIGANCSIGLPGFGYEKDARGSWFRVPHVGTVVIGEDVEIGSGTCIDRGTLGSTRILERAKIDNLVHVAHNVSVGRDSVIIANAMLGGSCTIGDGVWVAPSASLMNQLHVGDKSTIGMGAVVIRDVGDAEVVVGNPGRRLEKK